MDAILKRKAEQLASELATQAQTLDDVNGLLKMPDEIRSRTHARH